ncbi:hypothetical protein ES704_02769 [subsurface metagenome]|jgi:hypothetical protein
MFWIGLVVGIVLTLVVMFELGHYIERRKGNREKDGSKKGVKQNESRGNVRGSGESSS